MTLLRFEQSGELVLRDAGPAARRVRTAATGAAGSRAEWYPAFDRAHWRGAVALLVTLVVWGVLAPASLSGPAGGALLLIGGALIGLPHGSSDFVVAHRLLRPRLAGWWLPAFLIAYLLVTATVLLGWRFAPVGTFLAFLAVSGLHFGAAEEGAAPSGDAAVCYLARATTPIVPIFLCHPAAVAGIIGPMIAQPAAAVAFRLDQLRPAGLTLYAVLLGIVVLGALAAARRNPTSSRSREAVELVLLALAADLLPPLPVFAAYFCLLHAVRHMAQLGRDVYPRNGRAALGIAAAVVLPSALVCGVALSVAWDEIAGAMTTASLVATALQVTAALTVPHVLLEWWAARSVR